MGFKITVKKIKYRIISISITVVSLKNDTHAICYVAKLRLVDLEALLWASGTHSTVAAAAAAFTAFTGTVGAFVPRPFWSCLAFSVDASFPVAGETSHKPPSFSLSILARSKRRPQNTSRPFSVF